MKMDQPSPNGRNGQDPGGYSRLTEQQNTIALWQNRAYAMVMKVTEAIKAAIIESGQSQTAIANGASVAVSQICRLLSGERGLDVAAIERIADYLGYTVELKRKGGRKPRTSASAK